MIDLEPQPLPPQIDRDCLSPYSYICVQRTFFVMVVVLATFPFFYGIQQTVSS